MSENGLSKGLSLFVMSENRASNDVAEIHGPFGLTISANDNVPRVRTRHRGLTKIEINKSCLACGSKRQGIFKLKEIQHCAKVRHLDEVTHSALRGMTISVANDNIADLLQQVANTEQLTTTFLRAI